MSNATTGHTPRERRGANFAAYTGQQIQFHELVGARMHAMREAAGLTQAALAERIGYGVTTIQKAEDGRGFTALYLVLFAEALDVTIDEVVPTEATR